MRFGGSSLPAIRGSSGRTIQVNGNPATIVGVMPAGVVLARRRRQFWAPWRMNPDSLWTRNNHYLRLVGELKPGATVAQAQTQARTLNKQWMRDFPETYFPAHPITAAVTPVRDYLLGPTRPYMLALLGAVFFILLIACVNVANLLLVRGESRRKEFAIRTALGASGNRVVRQMLTESMLYAVLARRSESRSRGLEFADSSSMHRETFRALATSASTIGYRVHRADDVGDGCAVRFSAGAPREERRLG